MHQTYAETAALVAVMEEDYGEARRLIVDFYDNELSDFAAQVKELGEMLATEQRRRVSASNGYVPQR